MFKISLRELRNKCKYKHQYNLFNFSKIGRTVLNMYRNTSPNKRINFTSFKMFSSDLNGKVEEAQVEEEVELRQIQLNPKYEAGIGFFVTGDYDRAVKTLTDLKTQMCDDDLNLNDDYLFLLKKIVSINKVNKHQNLNYEILNEIKEISETIFKHDISSLFENLEFCIINLNNLDPKLTISFIDEILKDNAFPEIFEQIFIYYKASSYVLEGKNLDTAIQLFESIENKVDDKYLKSCLLNNKNCALWWTTLKKHSNEIQNKKLSFEILESIAKDVLSIIRNFKEALILIEDVENFKFNDKINYNSTIKPTEENLEEVRLNFLKFILSINFDLTVKLDSEFLKQMAANKASLTKIKTSAIVFSNLGEFYYNIKEYKKSLIFLNVANLFFQNLSNNDPLFFKNLSLVAMNNWKLTKKSEGAQQMFEKILSQIKQFQPNYEKVFIFRTYGEMLLEQNSQNVLGNNLIDEANKMEDKIPYFECRKLYLTLPSES